MRVRVASIIEDVRGHQVQLPGHFGAFVEIAPITLCVFVWRAIMFLTVDQIKNPIVHPSKVNSTPEA